MRKSSIAFLIGAACACAAVQLQPRVVHARDGIVEINQDRAVAGAVTPGDSPGFPVTISQSGAYRLSGALTVPNANSTAIVISADYVTLDLGGFAINGPTSCTGDPVSSCSPLGSGVGVNSGSSKGVRISNGVIRGMGTSGVLCTGSYCRVEHIQASSNGVYGIEVGSYAIVKDSEGSRNLEDGLTMGPNGIADTVSAYSNASQGIVADVGCILIHCVARDNYADGVVMNTYAMAHSVNSHDNGATGITVLEGSLVYKSECSGNNYQGISAGNGSLVADSVAKANSNLGFALGTYAGYRTNTLTGNNGGDANPQLSSGIQMELNMCGTDTICP